MAINIGTPLASSNPGRSEHEGKYRRQLNFDPHTGSIAADNSRSFSKKVGSFTSNLMFNFLDSVTFGVPSSRMRKNMQEVDTGIWAPNRYSYGDRWDRLGIKPREELSGADYFGYGLGQAAGFFVPFMKLSKATTALQRLAFSNFDFRIGEAIKNATKAGGLSDGSVKAIDTLVKSRLRGQKHTIPHIYRATEDQYRLYNQGILKNIELGVREGIEQAGKRAGLGADDIVRTMREAPDISRGILQNIEQFGNNRMFIDNLPDMVNSFALREGAHPAMKYVTGYVGRAIDQGINMALFDGLGRMTRAAFGEPIEGVDDVPLAKSLTHSAGFAAAIAFGDFIPGGRKAGMFRDFAKFAKVNLSKSRNFSQMHKNKDITDAELRSVAAYFSNVSGKTISGYSSKKIQAGSGDIDKIAEALDGLYSKNRKDLLKSIIKDSGKSLAGSLPRAGVDAMITASYMGMSGMAIINDEALIGDYLIGAFMAMRAHQPLNPRAAMRWRYNNTIDAKMNFMENMGMDVSQLKTTIPYMQQGLQEMQFHASNLEKLPYHNELYTALYESKEPYTLINTDVETRSELAPQRDFIRDLNTILIPSYIKEHGINFGTGLGELNQRMLNLEIPDAKNISNKDINRIWNSIKDINVHDNRNPDGMKRLGDYVNDFDSFLEAVQTPIANFHKNSLVNLARDVTRSLNIAIDDATVRDGSLKIRSFTVDPSANPEFSNIHYMRRVIDDLIDLGYVVSEPGSAGPINITEKARTNIADIDEMVNTFHEHVARELNQSFTITSTDNPSRDYISMHRDLVVKNRVKDIIRGIERKEDRPHTQLRNTIENIIGDTVPVGRRYIVSEAKEGKATDEARRESAETLLNSIIQLKTSANKIHASTGRGKDSVVQMDYEKALSFHDSLNKAGIAEVRDGQVYYGNHSERSVFGELQTIAFAESGLGDRDFIALRILQGTIGDNTGNIRIPMSTDNLTQLVRRYYEKHGSVDDAKVNNDVASYYAILQRLQATGRVQDMPGQRFTMTEKEASQLVSALESVRMLQDAKMDDTRASYARLAEDIEKRAKEVTRMAVEAKSKYNTSSNKEEAAKNLLDQAETLHDFMMADVDGLTAVIPRLVPEMGVFKDMIELARKDYNNIGEIFSSFDIISDASEYVSSLSKLVNTTSREGWSFANIANRVNIINELLKSDLEITRADLEKDDILALINRLGETGGDYKALTRVVDSIRDSVRANLGIHTSTVEYNSSLNTNILKESLDMLTSQERKIGIDSLMRRLAGSPGLKEAFMDSNSRFNQDFVSQLTATGEQFIANVKNIVKKIRTEIGNNDFRSDSDHIARELLSAVISVNTRKETRKYLTLDRDRLTVRTERNQPRTPMIDFIESINTENTRVIEISNNIIGKDGVVRRFTDSSSYHQIEKQLQDIVRVTKRDAESNKELRRNLGDVTRSEEIADRVITDSVSREGILDRPVFVDVKASDDIGIVFDLNRTSAGELLSRFNNFSDSFKEHINLHYGESAARRIVQWEAAEKNIKNSLKTLADDKIADAEMALGDLRAAVRSLYYGEHIGKDFLVSMLGESQGRGVLDVDSMSEAQQRAFKYIHHSDNSNATRINADVALRISDLLSNTEFGSGEQRRNMDIVASEARRRAEEGIRITFFDDNDITGRSTVGDVVRRTLRERYRNLNIDESKIEDLINKTIGDSESLNASIIDGSIYAVENSMRFDSYMMLRDFTEGSRAAKISFHSPGDGLESGLIAKMASRYDPKVSALMKKAGIDYIVPATSAKIHRSKDNFVKLTNYDVSKGFADNLGTITDRMVTQSFSPETVRYMFGAHEHGSQSRTNSSVTHYWNYEALADYSNKLQISNVVDKTLSQLNASLAGKDIAERRVLTNMLREKYDEIKNSGDYSHLGVIEQFIHWGLTSDSDLVRDQVVRHVRDIAITNAVSKHSSTVSNTFLFSNTELASPIFNSESSVSRYGEVYISSSMQNTSLGGNFAIVANRATPNDISDVVFGRRGKGFRTKDSTERKVDSAESKALEVIHKAATATNSYGNVHGFLTDVNYWISQIKRTPTEIKRQISNDNPLMAKELITALETLADMNIGDFAIAANLHKIPKKGAYDSVVNRIRGFVDGEKGNITELNNFEIAMQHQADQDGDKITAYLDNPLTALHSSMENMESGREPVSVTSGDEMISPNIFNLYGRDKTFHRNDGASRTSIDANSTLDYIGRERKSKMIVGSVVKMQGVMTMFKEAGFKLNGVELGQITGGGEPSRQYNYITSSLTQTVLDAWKGVNSSLLDIRSVKDFILFGETLEGIDYARFETFDAWRTKGGLFGDMIRGMNLEDGQVEVVRDIIRENIKIFERAYSVFGDTYDMGTTMKPTFDTMLYVKSQFDQVVNGDFTRMYRSIRARKQYSDNFNSYMQHFQKLVGDEAGKVSIQKQIVGFDEAAISRLKNAYPQLVALEAFTHKRNYGEIRVDQYDRPTEINRWDSDFQGVFTETVRNPFGSDTDNLISDLRIQDGVMDSIINDLRNTMKAESTLSQVTAPRRLSVLQTGLENHISSLKRRKYFYENIGHLEDIEVMKTEIGYYKGQLESVNERIANFNKEMIETGVVTRHSKGKRISAIGGPLYVYRVKSYKQGFDLEPVGTVRSGYGREFGFDTVALRNPIRVNDVSDRAIKEGIAFEAATLSSPMREGSYVNLLTDAGLSNVEASKIHSSMRSMIEHSKAEIRNIDAESYDLTKRVPGQKVDAYDDARLYVDGIFNNLFSRIDQFALSNNELSPSIYDVFARMLYSPRLVGSHVNKIGEHYVPYYKMDRKFTTHLTRYIKDYSDKPGVAHTFNSVDDIFNHAVAIINNREGITGIRYFDQMNLNRDTATRSYEASKLKGRDSLMESLMRMAGKDYEVMSTIEAMRNPRVLINDPGSLEFFNKTPEAPRQDTQCKVF